MVWVLSVAMAPWKEGWKRVCECGNKEESPGKTTWGSRHSTWGENEPRVLEIRGNVAAGK